MTIRVRCDCGKLLQVRDELEGKRVRCPGCEEPVLVTAGSPAVRKGRPARDADEEDDEPEDRPARKKAGKRRKGSNGALWLGLGGGAAALALVAVVVVVLVSRSGKKDKDQGRDKGPGPAAPGGKTGGPAAFLDQEKEIPSRLEWTREVASRRGGAISFRVTSQGPFGVTVISGRGFQALQAGGRGSKEDLLLVADPQSTSYEGRVTLPPGSSYIILENRAAQAVRFRLQCFEAGP